MTRHPATPLVVVHYIGVDAESCAPRRVERERDEAQREAEAAKRDLEERAAEAAGLSERLRVTEVQLREAQSEVESLRHRISKAAAAEKKGAAAAQVRGDAMARGGCGGARPRPHCRVLFRALDFLFALRLR